MASNNRSWMSSSSVGSRDQDDDCQSFEDQSQQNISISSGNSFGRSRARGSDRYNHYRREGPAKVKPWMRDKAITGTPGSRSQGRFGGSARGGVRSSQHILAEATSVGSNSCANSVCSNSSFLDAPVRPLPTEVAPDTPLSGRSLQYDDDSFLASEEVRQEEHLGVTGPFSEEITRLQKEHSSVFIGDVDQEEECTVYSEVGSTAVNTTQPTYEDKLNTEDDNAIPATNNESLDQGEDVSRLSADEQIDEMLHSSVDNVTPAPMQLAYKNDESSLADEEKSDKDDNLYVSAEPINNAPTPAMGIQEYEQPTGEPCNDVEVHDEPEQPQWRPVINRYDRHEVTKAIQQEFYDELPPVKPSAYNPMAAAKITTERSVAAYANMEKPTPLVAAQAALLNDAIAEEVSEEESSVDEYESNANNITADTLQGIKALDASGDESFIETDDVNFELSRIELDREFVADEFHKTWPCSVDPTDIPEIIFPADWEQRQTLAAGETQTWIHMQLQQKIQGIDFKAGAYSEFGAALSDCPPLTLAFLAINEEDVKSSDFACFCFCPCSKQMAPWRAEKLSDTEEVLYQDVIRCKDRQFTPKGLEEHCRIVMNTSRDLESRFLHGMVHKYLESLFGHNHAAFNVSVAEPKIDFTIGSACTQNETTGMNVGVFDNLKQSNAVLLEQVKLAEETRELLEAKSMEAAATSAEYEEQLAQLRQCVSDLEASNEDLVEQLRTAEETKHDLAAKTITAASEAAEQEDQLSTLRATVEALETDNKKLLDSLKVAEEKESLQEAKSIETAGSLSKLAEELKRLQERVNALASDNGELQQELESAIIRTRDLESKNAVLIETVKQQAAELDSFSADKKRLSESNAELTEKLRLAEEKHSNAVASSEVQAEMMTGLCEEMKQIEEAKGELQKKLEETEEKVKTSEAKHVAASTANIDATATIKKLQAEKALLEESNATLAKKLAAAEDREKDQASREQNVTLVHVGDMPVDLRRFHVQCQKYFQKLRVAQLKNHCIRDKSPVKVVVEYNANARETIDLQKILDKGAAVESQDETYLFRALDTFNKGHFHTHKLLLPWKIVTTTGAFVSRSEFFMQAWQQLGTLKITVGEKKTEVPLFQESLGHLIPMPNAVLEGMLRCTPDELDRIFAAKIAPYYRAIGRMMVQCIGATADDNTEYNLKIAGSVMPLILRHKLFRGVDPMDESYPLEQLLDHAFSLLGITDMTRDKAFEYFSIEAKDYSDTTNAVKQIRKEVHEMWIQERSLALQALEEGLTLGNLTDMSFICGLVPLEAVNEIIFTR